MTPQTDAEMGEVPSGSMESVPSMTDKAGPSTEPKLLTDRPLTLQTVNQLVQLIAFENLEPGFTANVPSCWVKIIQA